jgi:hypothetical protein
MVLGIALIPIYSRPHVQQFTAYTIGTALFLFLFAGRQS